MLGEGEGEAVKGCRLNEVYRERERNLYANGLSNCPKLIDDPRIKTVEYTGVSKKVLKFFGGNACESVRSFQLNIQEKNLCGEAQCL